MMQAHIFYVGTVQGVGLRFTVEGLARRIGLNGWVKNLSDGRVELMVEGENGKIKDLQKEIEDTFNSSIKGKEINFHPKSGEFKDFRITY